MHPVLEIADRVAHINSTKRLGVAAVDAGLGDVAAHYRLTQAGIKGLPIVEQTHATGGASCQKINPRKGRNVLGLTATPIPTAIADKIHKASTDKLRPSMSQCNYGGHRRRTISPAPRLVGRKVFTAATSTREPT
jgi:hypothetical protein